MDLEHLALGTIAGSALAAGLLGLWIRARRRSRRLRGLHAVDRERWDQCL